MTMITTIHGEMDESFLDKLEGSFENSNETTAWIEYRLKGQTEPIVHRSVHVTLKLPTISQSILGE
jgi:hypothetical protein